MKNLVLKIVSSFLRNLKLGYLWWNFISADASRAHTKKMANKKEEPEDSETSSSEKKSANSVLTKQEKLQQAIVLKDEGNAFYKQNDFKNAMKKYHHALLFVKGLAVEQPFKHILFYDNGEGEVTEEFKQKAQHTESICYNNLAGMVVCCLFKLKSHAMT